MDISCNPLFSSNTNIDIVVKYSCIQELLIKQTKLNEVTDAMLMILSKLNSLKKLNISNNKIDSSCVVALTNFVNNTNEPINELDLSINNLNEADI